MSWFSGIHPVSFDRGYVLMRLLKKFAAVSSFERGRSLDVCLNERLVI